jgi:hypothetical protein
MIKRKIKFNKNKNVREEIMDEEKEYINIKRKESRRKYMRDYMRHRSLEMSKKGGRPRNNPHFYDGSENQKKIKFISKEIIIKFD